ncbi:hypothetical protein FRB94_012668 [Tulasnella sp. JGI-2019a]|nr:hypothetical protein FRB94_012668 [Tulasnella sp. JGI-2019a]
MILLEESARYSSHQLQIVPFPGWHEQLQVAAPGRRKWMWDIRMTCWYSSRMPTFAKEGAIDGEMMFVWKLCAIAGLRVRLSKQKASVEANTTNTPIQHHKRVIE